MKTRTLVITNPTSGRAARAIPTIKSYLRQSGVDFDWYTTEHQGDATTRTRSALREGYQLMVVVGGDGTLSEVAAGFFDTPAKDNAISPINGDAAIAILPAGTGDDFARGLRGGRESLDLWLDTLVRFVSSEKQRAATMIDVIQGRASDGDFICLNVSTIGLGAEVAAKVAAQGNVVKNLPGEARFVSAAVSALAAWRERRVRLTIDGSETIDISTNLIAVANGVFAGGGMMFAPQASLHDGKIDLLMTRDLTRRTILRELPRIRRGEHLANPKVRLLKVGQVRIDTEGRENQLLVEADGNVRGHTPAEFQIMPKALRVVL